MINDQAIETLEYAKEQALLMRKEALETLYGDEQQLFLLLMECAIKTINRKLDEIYQDH